MIACFVPNQVTYETTGFLQKNRDLLHLDSIQLLSSCSCHLPQAFASSMLIQSEKPVVGPLYKAGGADSQRLSVATKFKGQLFQLMQRLGNTTPQFIGCIMPNNVQSSGLYEKGLAKMLWGHRSGSNLTSVPKKKGRLVGLGRRTRSVPPSSAQPPFVDPEVLTAQLKDKDDRISLLETQMAAQQAGYEAQRRLNQQMMKMMQRMYPNEVFPNVPDL
ncbi:hypothetical protein DY000_02049757 [Brassica cretica]|uniref:Myosin motor domain-containing protein n=1 Tax=Brassica cretica TaxID=69181 RepID=A0ABQ7F8D3_BRACR|nr:hypothetical protein DY000_02049757 [Brassica cretica]